MTIARWPDVLAQAGRTRCLTEQAERLHALVREPWLRQDRHTETALGVQVSVTVATLRQLHHAQADLNAAVTAAFAAHPHAPIYLSFPGVGSLTGARLLAEIGDDPDRFLTARGLRADSGAAPLTWASGTARVVTHRQIANRHLTDTAFFWAFTSLQHSPGCRAHYDRRRAHGDAHAAALRHLSGRLLSGLHYCLRHACPYDETAAWSHTDPATYNAQPRLARPEIAGTHLVPHQGTLTW